MLDQVTRSAAAAGTETQRSLRSPVLDQLRLNPFRVLRIPLELSTEEALWKAEELTTLSRAGFEAAEPDSVPWLPLADEYELHQVVQAIEEPFRRLKEQFFWFDFQHDPAREQLRAVLTCPTAAGVAEYLAIPVELHPYDASAAAPASPTPAAPAGTSDPPATGPAQEESAASPPESSAAVRCSRCGVWVTPEADGRCPSCQGDVREPLDAASETPQPSTVAPVDCQNCGASVIPHGAGYCPVCWSRVDRPAERVAASSEPSGSSLVQCANCGVSVVPKSDGRCPSCQSQLPESARSPAEPAPAAAASRGTPAATPQPAPSQAGKGIANGDHSSKARPDAVSRPAPAEVVEAVESGAKMRGLSLPAAALALNQANLSLMWAAVALHRFLDVGDVEVGRPQPPAERLSWQTVDGKRWIENLHERTASDKAMEREMARLEQGWADAVRRWGQVLKSREFRAAVSHSIAELGDELIGEDDVDMIGDAVGTQFSDLLLNELKLQVIDGRYDRVEMLLRSVAKCELDLRKWSMAFRPLRALFETELRDLQVLADLQPQRAQNLAVFLDRLAGVSSRWGQLDADGVLGLRQMVDDRLRSVFNGLKAFIDLATVDKIVPLLERVRDLASVNSLKQEVEAYLSSIRDTSDWECYFCRVREGEIDRYVVLEGKKETGRVRHFNSTTIYYSIMRKWVPRCGRCADLHAFFLSSGRYVWLALLAAFLQIEYYFMNVYIEWALVIRMASAAAVYWASGHVVRYVLANRLTLPGERPYHKCDQSKPYQELRKDGYGVTVNYSRNAMDALRKKK